MIWKETHIRGGSTVDVGDGHHGPVIKRPVSPLHVVVLKL